MVWDSEDYNLRRCRLKCNDFFKDSLTFSPPHPEQSLSFSISQAFVIAYTSDFIPRMVYKFVYSHNHDLKGYIYHSLSKFNTSDYKAEWGLKNQNDPDTCQYRGYRNDYDHDEPYDLSPVYWHVFAARLAFVVVFEHLVFIISAFMQFLIPDIPTELKTQQQREQLLAKEAKYQNGVVKAQEYEDLLAAIRDNNKAVKGGGELKNVFDIERSN